MTAEREMHRAWPDAPLSAPLWAWLLYFAITTGMCALAIGGGMSGIIAVMFEGGFSFQFWTVAARSRSVSRG